LGEHHRLKTLAAIKVLHTQLAEGDIDGFLREAQFIANLERPNIVRILDFDVEGGIPFLVMGYASNGTLRQLHPKDTILPLSTVGSYVKQVADALQYAHDEKLIHRDIKPENMLVGRRGDVLLSDFGIALVAQSSRYQSTQEMAGTMAYMPPEQIHGKPRPASDQYALGITVYEWLTGDRPFHGSAIEIVAQHLAAPPTPLREKVPTLPADIERVVLTALAKDPKDRFSNIRAFSNALEQASQSRGFSVPEKLPTPTMQETWGDPSPSRPLPQPAANMPPPSLASNVGECRYILRGHTAKVNVVAWSLDGKYIASGSSDGTVQMWNANSGQRMFTVKKSIRPINSLTWSPDSLRIASAGADKLVHVWDANNGNEFFIYRGHSRNVKSVAWSPDGRSIASAGEENAVHIRDARNGTSLSRQFQSFSMNVIQWTPDNQFIICASNNSEVQVLDVNTMHKVTTYNNYSGWIGSLACSPNGQMVASAGLNPSVYVWMISNGKHVLTFSGHSGSIYALVWSPSGTYIASGDVNGKIRIWNARNGERVYTYHGHNGAVYSLAWSPNGKYIASADDDNTVQVWATP